MYSWSISWISWCLDGASKVCGCNRPLSSHSPPTRARPSCSRAAGGSVKRGFSLFAGDFLSSQTDGGCCSLVSRRKRRDRGWRGRETGEEEWGGGGGCCIAQQRIMEGVAERKLVDLRFPPLFYISIVFGQAPLYMCNYHWHCYFFRTQVQASPGWLVCFVSPGHS